MVSSKLIDALDEAEAIVTSIIEQEFLLAEGFVNSYDRASNRDAESISRWL